MYIYKAENQSKAANLLVKVPEITFLLLDYEAPYYWYGEVASDYLFERLNPLISLPLSVAIFIAAMILQFKAKRYVPSLYWLVVIMVSIFGTTAADVVRVGLGIPYVASTIFFAVMLAAVLITWYIKEGTLSVHHINTRRREIFYWLTVSTTFALGTAAGDMTASNMHLGYLSSGIMFSVVLIIPALGYWLFNMKEVAAFWFAYIMTRPVGASFADWLSASHADGGAGYGKGSVSLILFVIIVLLVFIRGGAPAKIEDHQHSVTNP